MQDLKLTCPSCGSEARRSDTRFGVRHDCCGLWSWGGKPLVDGPTHEARRRAHESFDRLWVRGYPSSRTRAYKGLSEHLGVAFKDCHISLFDRDTCERVISYSDRLIQQGS